MEDEQGHDSEYFVIKNASKHSLHSSKRVDRERSKVAIRIAKNRENYYIVKNQLDKIFQGKATARYLRPLSGIISFCINVPLDRIAKRYYDALLCWFVENWKAISAATPIIKEALNKMNIKDHSVPEIKPEEDDNQNKMDQIIFDELSDVFDRPFNDMDFV